MTRSNYHATEGCACGATITVDAYTTDDLRESLMAFRVGHRHVVGVFARTETAPFICTCGTSDLIIACPIHGDEP